jgi:hypothetical protein
MVQIVIRTADAETAVTTQREEAEAPATPETPAGRPEPPAEVLAAAAAVGARDAGPAPVEAAPTTGAAPLATFEQGAPATVPGDASSAGAAPGAQLEPQPTVVTEDGE